MLKSYSPCGGVALSLIFVIIGLPQMMGAGVKKPLESISLSTSISEFSGCPGDTLAITGILVNTDCADYELQWSSEEDSLLTHCLDANTLAPQIIVQNFAATYKLKVTEICTGNMDSLEITILPSLMAVAGTDRGLCADKTSALGATAVAGVTYSWTPAAGLNNATVANPAVAYAGNNTIIYTLTVQDTSGCVVQDSVQVQFYELPAPAFVADTTCEGTATSFINQTPDATTINSWFWTFQGSNTTSNVFEPSHIFSTGGKYSVSLTATSAQGCVSTITRQAEVASMPAINGVIKADPNDCNATDGRIVITANTGYYVFPGLQYSIDGGNTWTLGRTFNGLGQGNYNIKVSNGGVCVQNGNTVSLQEPPRPVIAGVAKNDPSDCQIKNGSIQVTAGGGIGSLLYSIDGFNWQPGNSFSGLGSGSYPVLVRNADGTCQVNNGVTILSEPASPVITFVAPNNPSDCGATDGNIKIRTTGGLPPHQYSINGGTSWVSQDSFPALAQGIYDIRVRNANQTCVVTGGGVNLEDPAAPQVNSLLPSNPTDCGLKNGVIEIDATPGAAATQYSINGGLTWFNSGYFPNLGTGNFKVRLRNANGTCIVNGGNIILAEPFPPLPQSPVAENPSDCGVQDGNIFLEATGGAGTYQFSIDGGGTWSNGGSFQNLPGGDFNLKIRNFDGTCVTDAGQIRLTAPEPPANVTFTANDPTICKGSDGWIEMTAQSQNGVEFSIDGGDSWLNSARFEQLSEGTYLLQVRNLDGTCLTTVGPADLTAPASIELTAQDFTHITDCGKKDGNISISTNYSGNAALEFSIDGGNSWHSDAVFSGLTGGDYLIKVRATDGSCTVEGQTIKIKTPSAPQIADIVYVHPGDCKKADGKLLFIKSDTIPFEISLDGGLNFAKNNFFTKLEKGSYFLKVRNEDGTCLTDLGTVVLTEPAGPSIENITETHPATCVSKDGAIVIATKSGAGQALHCSIDGGVSWQQLDDFQNLGQGNYPTMVRNADKTCEEHGPTVALKSTNDPVTITINAQKPDCGLSNGFVEIQADGGVNLQYSIDGGETWQDSAQFHQIAADQYHIQVREADQNDCLTDGGIYVLEEKGHPVFNSFTAVSPSHCLNANGFVEVDATGNVGPLQYSADGGFTWQNQPLFTGLNSGNYQLMVRYANGSCAIEGDEAILAAPGAPVVAKVFTTDPECSENNGIITISATTPAAALEYSIDGGQHWVADSVFSDLASGLFEVLVRNEDGVCQASGGIMELSEPLQIEVEEIFTKNPDCFADDGRVEIKLENELPGITEYSLNDGAVWQSSNVFENLPHGNFKIKVRNMSSGNWCQTDAGEIVLTKPTPPGFNISLASPSDCGENDGRIRVTASGNTPVEYSLDGDTWRANGFFTGLPAGTYQAHVRFADGSCEVTSNTLTLTAPVSPVLDSVYLQHPDCFGNDGAITIAADNGSGDFEYSIDGGAQWGIESVYENLEAGVYDIRVRNSDGSCEVIAGLRTLVQPAMPGITIINPTMPDCGLENGQLEIIAELGGEPLNVLEYSVDNGNHWQTSNVFDNLRAGNYRIMLRRNDILCEVDGGVFSLAAPESPRIVLVEPASPSNCGMTDGYIEIFATGRNGVPNSGLEYSINDGATWQASPVFQNLGAGNYQVKVRFNDGSCEVTGAIYQLTEPAAPQRTALQVEQPDCDRQNGTLQIAGSGDGHSPLEYSIDGGANWAANGTFSGIGAGQVSIMIRYADETCPTVDTVFQITAKNQPVVAGIQSDEPSGCDAQDGKITINASGYMSLEYSLNEQDWQASNIFDGLPDGDYTLHLRYSDGTCRQPGGGVTLLSPNTATISQVEKTDLSDCDTQDGEIIITASGAGDLEYTLNGQDWQDDAVFKNLSAGIYQPGVRLKNADCQKNWGNLSLSRPDPLEIDTVLNRHISDCGSVDGRITIRMTQDIPMQFSIDGGASWSFIPVFNNLPKGEYNIVVRKADGSCETFYQYNPVPVGEPAAPLVALETINPECRRQNGSIAVIPTILSNPANLAIEYALNNGNWTTDSLFLGLGEGNYDVKVRLAGTNCESQGATILAEPLDCPPCQTAFRADTLMLNQATMVNPVCIPMELSKTLNYELYLDGARVTAQGGCDVDSVFYYGYHPLVTLGGSDGPFRLVSWSFNGTTYSGNFTDLDALADSMSRWDISGDWTLDPVAFNINGGAIGNHYGNLIITHVRTNRTITLMSNRQPVFNSLRLNVTGAGWHTLVANNPADACADTLRIHVEGLHQSQLVNIYKRTRQNQPVQICDWSSYLNITPSILIINSNPDNGTLQVVQNTCAFYTPAPGFAGYNSFELFICEVNGAQVVCDTAIVHIAVEPPKDTIYLMAEPGLPLDTCLNALIQLPAAGLTAAACGGDQVTFTADAGNEICMSFVPDAGFTGLTEICVVHCDDIAPPLGPLCDTTILIFDVMERCAEEIFENDTVSLNVPSGFAGFCIPIPGDEIDNYNLTLDGSPYNLGFADCDFDTIFSYYYFILPGMGNTGPYQLNSWTVNGNTFSGMFSTIDALVDSMNNWDPDGNWENFTGFFSIQGGATENQYGSLQITHLGMNVTLELQPTLIPMANGTEISISGAGLHFLVVENTINTCRDMLYINIEGVVVPDIDTLVFEINQDDTLSGACLPVDELFGLLTSIDFCSEPANGTMVFDGSNCFSYIPDPGYAGEDTACVVICDDLGVCDTTIVFITVAPVNNCDEIFDIESMIVEVDYCDGEGEVCLPVHPAIFSTLEVLDNGAPYSGTMMGCDFDTLVMYNIALLPGNGLQGPYRLESWSVNGDLFTANFSDVTMLVDSMNRWDSGGNWRYNAMTRTIFGGIPANDYGALVIVQTSSGIQRTIESARSFNPMGTRIKLSIGQHQIVVNDNATGCSDTINVALECGGLNDLNSTVSVQEGGLIVFCLDDLNINFDPNYIQSVVSDCAGNDNADFIYNDQTNCIEIQGAAMGTDTACYRICLGSGDCFTWTILTNISQPCPDFISKDELIVSNACGQTNVEFCVDGFSSAIAANYTLEINGQPYGGTLTPCGFDSIFAMSYFDLPGAGGAGPYRVVNWTVNNQIFSGDFQDVNALVDSMNLWDPTGNWVHNPSGASIVGGNPANNYGQMEIIQILTSAPAILQFNSSIIPRGISVSVAQPGNYQLVFTESASGCLDSVSVSVVCVTTETLRDTVFVGEVVTICLPTNEIQGSQFTLANFCEGESGELVMFDWAVNDTCIVYEGVEPGTERACFVLCNESGLCDTTYIFISVLQQDSTGINAAPDTIRTLKGNIVMQNVLLNDNWGSGVLDTFFIVQMPAHGFASFLPDGTLQYNPDSDYCDDLTPDRLQYAICKDGICEIAEVVVWVSCEELRIYNGFSPNNDDINDTFRIDGLDRFPNNHLQVFSRWGNKVFEAINYKNDWGGKWNGADLADGTYFYLFDDGNGKVYSGYVQIQR